MHVCRSLPPQRKLCSQQQPPQSCSNVRRFASFIWLSGLLTQAFTLRFRFYHLTVKHASTLAHWLWLQLSTLTEPELAEVEEDKASSSKFKIAQCNTWTFAKRFGCFELHFARLPTPVEDTCSVCSEATAENKSQHACGVLV